MDLYLDLFCLLVMCLCMCFWDDGVVLSHKTIRIFSCLFKVVALVSLFIALVMAREKYIYILEYPDTQLTYYQGPLVVWTLMVVVMVISIKIWKKNKGAASGPVST